MCAWHLAQRSVCSDPVSYLGMNSVFQHLTRCRCLPAASPIRRALPALPFSIALGVVFYFLTRIVLEPYVVTLVTAGTYY